jgi:hypothetical protein
VTDNGIFMNATDLREPSGNSRSSQARLGIIADRADWIDKDVPKPGS